MTPEERAEYLVEIKVIDKSDEIRLVGEFKAIYRECMEIAENEAKYKPGDKDFDYWDTCALEIVQKIKKAGNIIE